MPEDQVIYPRSLTENGKICDWLAKAGWVPLFTCRYSDSDTLKFRDIAHLHVVGEYKSNAAFNLAQWTICADRGDIFMFNQPRNPVPGHIGYQLIVWCHRKHFQNG